MAGTACSALLALVLLLGGLEIHPAGEHHDPIAGLVGGGLGGHQDVYFPGASHPVARPHAEPARAVPRPFCAVCLNRLQGGGVHLARAASLSKLAAASTLPPAAATSPLRRSLRPDGARAPPFA